MRYKKHILIAFFLAASVLLCGMNVSAKSNDDEIKVRRVEIAPATITVRVNQTRTLSVDITPRDADDQDVYWESGNWEIVSVDGDGTITGISPGTAEVTATSDNGRVGKCIVTVPGTAIRSNAFVPDIQSGERPEAAFTSGERLTAVALRVDVQKAVGNISKNATAYVTYRDKTTVSTAALRGAAFVVEQNGGAARIRFQTLAEDGSIQGQITVDPGSASSEDKDIKVGVYTIGSKVDAARSRAAAHIGADVVVVVLDHPGSYEMEVSVAAKLELADANEQTNTLYRWNGSKYVQVETGNIYMDDSGFLHFSATEGGEYVIVI